jgi:hypothetical protein
MVREGGKMPYRCGTVLDDHACGDADEYAAVKNDAKLNREFALFRSAVAARAGLAVSLTVSVAC